MERESPDEMEPLHLAMPKALFCHMNKRIQAFVFLGH